MGMKIEFETDNAAFLDEEGGSLRLEVAVILGKIAGQVMSDMTSEQIVDSNGNTVGSWSLNGPASDG